MDYGERYAEKKISAVNRELRKTYRTAQAELKKKLADFEKRHEKENKRKKEQLAAGEITKQDYKDWLTGQVFIRNQWQANLRQVCKVMHDANNQTMNIINNSRFDVFAENYNFNAWQAEKAINVSFSLYNAESVARLMTDDPQLLPEWKIDEEKDYIWNYNRVNNIVRQGIIQGEGIPEITDRLCSALATSNDAKMRMFARTALGAAQSAGRQKQMEDAAAMGIEVHKAWRAAHDSRTRDAHRDLDGQEVPYDKPFKSELGEIMYPKDPTAAPANVFNCRCTMVTIYPKYEDRSKKYGEGEIIDGQSYEEWKKGKKARGEVQPEKPPIEQFRKAAETASNKVEFWMNLDEKQQAELMASGMKYDEVFEMLGGGKKVSEWKEANPGGAESFAISHDFSNATIHYNRIAPKGEGWMADANGTGEINIRKNGLGDDWEFIVTHELGHQLANYSPELQQMIMYNPGNVLGRYNMRLMAFDGVYGEYNPEEAFATSVSVYIRHPKAMKERYPETYNAIDALFTASPSARKFIDDAVSAYRREFGK